MSYISDKWAMYRKHRDIEKALRVSNHENYDADTNLALSRIENEKVRDYSSVLYSSAWFEMQTDLIEEMQECIEYVIENIRGCYDPVILGECISRSERAKVIKTFLRGVHERASTAEESTIEEISQEIDTATLNVFGIPKLKENIG